MARLAMRWAPLTELVPHVPDGPYGTFARYLARQEPDGAGVAVGDRDELVFAVAGEPVGHPEVSFAWLFGPPGETLEALVAQLLPMMPQPRLAFLPTHTDAVRAAGLTPSRDLLLVHDGPVPDSGTGRPFDERAERDRVVASLRDHLPPPGALEHVPFAFWGLEEDDQIVAILDATVDDGAYAVLQQVFTDPRRTRRGLATRLLAHVVRALREQGRTPTYVVSADNAPSVALAERVGFRRALDLGVIAETPR